tara:strand:- start:238 stop:678 length:441 start_codon:yes stop_codon:yes gene_type:complete
MENNTKVTQAITKKDQQDCFSIRIEVFVEEQGVPSEEELDELDTSSFHALARINTFPVGTGRLIPEGNNYGRIGRMAVRKDYRRFGVGGLILTYLEEIAVNEGIIQITLDAQEYVKQFYLDHGYQEQGDIFLEVGIPHVTMVKIIN